MPRLAETQKQLKKKGRLTNKGGLLVFYKSSPDIFIIEVMEEKSKHLRLKV
ncbi:MAG: hypothetical protein QOC96_1427 [Acidobacteriota bacterium]|jgi:hypothetical protein|nr:hypothetical protein [Acidobacteriota bacterium]